MVSNSDIDIYQTYQTYQTWTFLPSVLQGFIHPGMIHGNVISPVVGGLEDLSPEVEVLGIQEIPGDAVPRVQTISQYIDHFNIETHGLGVPHLKEPTIFTCTLHFLGAAHFLQPPH